MASEDKRKLEKQALALYKQGMKPEAIEAKLGAEFIFKKDALTEQVVDATHWKARR